ncbi:MAG TPA: CBS domain-containing protein [Actinomycetota bacterium]|nr:CBS domain-containing protein [Actinomycetota bacterium]
MDRDAFRRNAEEVFGTVGAAMTANVLTFAPEDRASDAVLRLGMHNVAGAPVLRDGRVVGIITLRDLLEHEGHATAQTSGPFLRAERHLASLTVADVMTLHVVTVRATEPLIRAVDLMDAGGVNRLPVVDEEERSVGILARDDVIRAIARVVREFVPTQTHPGAPELEAD